ncbi:hypothetical protein [Klebsiella pneumoniae]|uniref:hypothetical protein n=1 Tax=Klebsiella pneumoniae TaxID=573 RepID=UPI003F1AA8A4
MAKPKYSPETKLAVVNHYSLRRRAMASGTELRLCRVAAAPYPAYRAYPAWND